MNILSAYTGKVVVMHPCPLTLAGLQRFLGELLPQANVRYTRSLEALRNDPLVPQADFIISELYDVKEGAKSAIIWFAGLQLMRNGRPLLVLTDDEEIPELTLLLESPGASLASLREQQDALGKLIGDVLAGSRVVNQRIRRPLRREPREALTAAELQVYALLQKGYGVSQIAARLCRSVKTVSTHKRRVMAKLNVRSEVELFSYR